MYIEYVQCITFDTSVTVHKCSIFSDINGQTLPLLIIFHLVKFLI